jgi:hypothetical protein
MGYSAISKEIKSIQWGIRNESVAKQQYIEAMIKKGHKRISVMDRGLIVQPSLVYLGASPDGFIYCADRKHYHRVLEIKCPFKWRMVTPRMASKDKDFYCYIDSKGRMKLKRNSNYFYQVQGQLALTRRKMCDFVVWTTKGIAVVPIQFCEDFWTDEMLPKLEAFFKNAILPEIVTRKIQKSNSC